MPAAFKKIARLAADMKLDASSSVLSKKPSGYNWHIAPESGVIAKRPGFLPFAFVPLIDEKSYLWVGCSPGTADDTRPYVGVLGGAIYAVPESRRRYPWSTATIAGETCGAYRSEKELSVVAAGAVYSLRLAPAFRIPGAAAISSYDIAVDSTGALKFNYYLSGAVSNSYTITAASTISDLVSAFGGTLNTSLAGIGGLPAFSVVRAPDEKGAGAARRTSALWVYCWYPFASPNCDSASLATARPRTFWPSTGYSYETPVQIVQYNEWLLMAGCKDRLSVYDGFRTSIAGPPSMDTHTSYTPEYQTNYAAGGLTGDYTYILRHKYVSTDDVISYGPAYTISAAGLAAQEVVFTFGLTNHEKGYPYVTTAAGNTLSQGFRKNTITGTTVAGAVIAPNTTASGESLQLQPGEVLFPSAGIETTVISIAVSGNVTLSSAIGAYPVSINERVEIFRNTAGGSAWYLVTEQPYTAGLAFTDNTSDATLVTNDSYLATGYTPTLPPDSVVAACVHQNRAVVLGEANDYVSTIRTRNHAIPTQSVWYTEPNTLEFTVDNNFVVNVPDGDELVACASHEDALFLFSSKAAWIVSGALSSAETFSVNNVPSGRGAASNSALASLRGVLFALSKVGVYAVSNGASDTAVGKPVNAFIQSLSAKTLRMSRLYADETAGRLYVILPGVVVTETARSTTLPNPNDEVTNNTTRWVEQPEITTILCYDVVRDAWYRYKPKVSVAAGIVGGFGLPKLDGAPITELKQDWARDAWVPFTLSFEAPWEDLDDPTTNKNFVRAQVLSAEDAAQNFSLDVTTETNWNSRVAMADFTLDFASGAGYADVGYATVPYGDVNQPDHVRPLTNHKAKSMRLVLENSDPAEKPTISGWALEVAANTTNAKED